MRNKTQNTGSSIGVLEWAFKKQLRFLALANTIVLEDHRQAHTKKMAY